MVDYKVLDLEFKGPNPLEVSKALGVSSDTIAEWYAGYTDTSNDLIDITGNGRSLADTGSPVATNSILTDHENNPIKEFVLNGTTQCFSKAHEGWMNRFSVDFAMTFVVKSPSSAPGSAQTFFCHGETIVSGIYVQMDTSGYYKVYLSKAGSSVNAVYSTNMADGYYHVIHVNRYGTSVNIYVDGVAGTSADPSTFGIDVSEVMYLGSYRGPAGYWASGLVYARLQRYALSTDRITQEVQYWKGIWAGAGGRQLSATATFTRSSASLTERVTGANPVGQANPNWPVKSPDSGMLVQGDVAQLCQNTRAFGTSPWSTSSPTLSATQTNQTGVREWTAIACDADGTNLIACVYDGYVYTSSDSGVNWAKCTSLGAQRWCAVASDSDGSNLIACSGQASSISARGWIYTSSDSGATWTRREVDAGASGGSYYWTCCASDSDGSFLIAGTIQYLYFSTDSGATWTVKAPGAAAKQWVSVASDADGSNLVAAETTTGRVWVSIDSGANWTEKTSGLGTFGTISGVCSDDVGTKLAFCATAGNLYTTINGGTNWTSRSPGGAVTYKKEWGCIASSTNGNNLIVCPTLYGASIYTSVDSGANWTERTTGINHGAFRAVASDSDGSFLVVIHGAQSAATTTRSPGKLFISSNSGANWAAIADPTERHWVSMHTLRTAADSTGTNLLVTHTNYMYVSNDGGTTWTMFAFTGMGFGACAVSSDGSKMIVGGNPSVYISADYGATWTQCTFDVTPRTWTVGISANGGFLIAAGYTSYIWTSSDGGANWTRRDNAGSKGWSAVVPDEDGSHILAIAGYLYNSVNYGVDWTERTSFGAKSFVGGTSDTTGSKLAVIVNPGYIYTSIDGGANWTQRDSSRAWGGIAGNNAGSGTVLAATLSYFDLYISTDSGATWVANAALGSGLWFGGAAVDADGSHIFVGNGVSDFINKSTDTGATWTQLLNQQENSTSPRIAWRQLCSDSDGSNLLLGGFHSYLYTSSDSGATWTERPAAGFRFWSALASDSDGSFLLACCYGNPWTSSDSGATWTERTGYTLPWTACACDADGSNLIACGNQSVYTSINSGAAWTYRAGPGTRNWRGAASDSVGTKLAVAAYGHYIWTSANGGANWTQQNNSGSRNWNALAGDSDLSFLIAAEESGYIFISSNSGVDWTQCTSAGSRVWYGVWCDSTGANLAACTATGLVYVSSDSGGTWSAVYSSTYSSIRQVVKVGTGYYIAVDQLQSTAVGHVYNLAYSSYETTCSAAAITSPDGTASSFSLISSAANQEHAVIQQITLTAAYYTFEVDVTTGDKNWVYIEDQTVSNAYAYFNTTNGVVGTTGAGCTASIYNRSGRRRCAICVLGTAATHTFQISPAASDGVLAFAGDGATPNVYVWEASCHLGKFQTLPVTRTTGAVTRSADTLTYPSTFIPGYFIGNTYHNKSIIIEVKVKCQYTDTNDIGANTYRPFITIGGNAGTATATRNHISIRAYNQYVYAHFYGSAADTEHYMRHTVADANKWHVYRLKLNFTTLSSSTFTKDDVAFTPGEVLNMDASAYDFDATNCLLRIGQTYDGTVSGFCEIAYVKIWVGT